jgi:hypothetical protein
VPTAPPSSPMTPFRTKTLTTDGIPSRQKRKRSTSAQIDMRSGWGVGSPHLGAVAGRSRRLLPLWARRRRGLKGLASSCRRSKRTSRNLLQRGISKIFSSFVWAFASTFGFGERKANEARRALFWKNFSSLLTRVPRFCAAWNWVSFSFYGLI